MVVSADKVQEMCTSLKLNQARQPLANTERGVLAVDITFVEPKFFLDNVPMSDEDNEMLAQIWSA